MKFTTIRWVDDEVEILDQALLPNEEKYIRLKTSRDVVYAIKSLQVRGAPLIGIAAAYGIVLALKASRNRIEFALAVNDLKSARPTAVNLSWAVERMMIHFHAYADAPDCVQRLLEVAKETHKEDELMCDRIGQLGKDLIADNATVLTHCNAGALATGGCGTALGVIYHAHWNGRKPKVIAGETRPILQGARLTTWELFREGIDVTLVTDSSVASLMAQGKIDCVIVGADRIAANHDVANKIGTYSIAVLAKCHDIPFYVAAPTTTFDYQIASGDEIKIELRGPEEISIWSRQKIVPDYVRILNPAFDITPNEYITAIISDREIIKCGRAD